jgi:hypothetical protein
MCVCNLNAGFSVLFRKGTQHVCTYLYERVHIYMNLCSHECTATIFLNIFLNTFTHILLVHSHLYTCDTYAQIHTQIYVYAHLHILLVHTHSSCNIYAQIQTQIYFHVFTHIACTYALVYMQYKCTYS